MNSSYSSQFDLKNQGDLVQYFAGLKKLIQDNSGNHSSYFITTDCYDKTAPFNLAAQPKVPLTASEMDVIEMDKSYITLKMRYRVKLDVFTPPATHVPYASDIGLANYFFIGFKASIHGIDTYNIYNNGRQTDCQQNRASWESFAMSHCKPADEVEFHPNMFTTWENAHAGIQNVCGTYATVTDLANGVWVEFPLTIKVDDFMSLSAWELYPAYLFDLVELQIKLATQSLVYCQVGMRGCADLGRSGLSRAQYTDLNGYGANQEGWLNFSKEFNQINDPSDMYLALATAAIPGTFDAFGVGACKLNFLDIECTQFQSHINGFGLNEMAKRAIAQAIGSELIIPAQFIDVNNLGQAPTASGVNSNTTFSVTNCSNMLVAFPRTSNQITVFSNPHLAAIQLNINNKNVPIKPFDTINDPVHLEYQLTNYGLEDFYRPTQEFIDAQSLTEVRWNGVQYTKVLPERDHTSYLFNVSLERLTPGYFSDGLTTGNGYANVALRATHMYTNTLSPYYSPVNTPGVLNTNAPIILAVQDCFWVCKPGEGIKFMKGPLTQ